MNEAIPEPLSADIGEDDALSLVADSAIEITADTADIPTGPVEFVVNESQVGTRLDFCLAHQFTSYSRVHLRRAITAGLVTVNGRRVKAAHHMRPGDLVLITLPNIPREYPQAENVPLDILYEDASLAVVNKPAGMVVHPGRGHWSGTLTAALQFHFDQLSSVGGPARPGIVHRLDRDTSGVLIVAKSDQTHMLLSQQFENRTVEKEYIAIVVGEPDRDRDVVDLPIGPHPYSREKKAIRRDHADAKPAQTFYEVAERLRGFAIVRAFPKTGRTHQIRLHLAHIRCPVLCDRLYGGRARITLGELTHRREEGDVMLERQALHARRLKILHPHTREPMEFVAPIPADLQRVIEILRR
jgi:23S rRNA pseudouridine1911/1915/1917 synthase